MLDTCPFVGPLIPLFRTSGDVSSGFQRQSGQPYSRLVEAYVIYVMYVFKKFDLERELAKWSCKYMAINET